MVYDDENSGRLAVAESDASGDPIAILERDQDEYLKLCHALEEVADALPGNVDFIKAEAAVLLLRDGFANHVSAQEEVLFPALRRRAAPGDRIDVLLGQAEYEHAVDQGLAVEVSEALASLIDQRHTANPEMVGYLLRCFFEGYRRHAAWERNVIYVICRQRLTEDDCAELALRLAGGSRFTFVHSPQS